MRERVRRNICITRIVMYLYAAFILHQMDAKPILILFEKLYESYFKILEVLLLIL